MLLRRLPGGSMPRLAERSVCEVVPGSSAQYAEAAISMPHRAIARIPCIFSIPAILGPFPHVAVHVVETPRIRTESVDTNRRHPALALDAAAICCVAIVV